MAIDEPLNQAISRVAADQRQSDPATKLLKNGFSFAAVISYAMKAWHSGDPGDYVRALSSGVKSLSDALGESNAEYLLSVVIPEMQRLSDRFDELEGRHQMYLDTDWLALLADADHKARLTRGRDKVARIGAILNDAAWKPDQAPDETEEMMRVAMAVEDRDLFILSRIARYQRSGHLAQTGRAKHYDAYQAWRMGIAGELRGAGFSDGETESRCLKLESFGLISRTERNVNIIADDPTPFALLSKGDRFLAFVPKETLVDVGPVP
jgi:hypothetical protein